MPVQRAEINRINSDSESVLAEREPPSLASKRTRRENVACGSARLTGRQLTFCTGIGRWHAEAAQEDADQTRAVRGDFVWGPLIVKVVAII